MKVIDSHTVVRGLNKGLLALAIALCLLFATTLLALANTVYISDAANVLNQNQVKSVAATLPNPISIYTTKTFNGSKSEFDQQAKSHITSSNMIVMAIDTAIHHLVIVGGSSVPLSNSQYQDAIQSFKDNFNGNYTNATIASIHTLGVDLGANPASNNNNSGVTAPTTSSGGFFSSLLFPLCCVGVILLVIVGVLFTVGRRMFGFGRRQGGGGGIPYQQPYNQPFNQGYPPNYGGPGYYQGQGQGMNPWAAGGIGAAAGGLIGYELGKEQGEDQARQQDWDQGQGGQGGGDFGGGASGDFGGGGGGDFGGGGGGGSGDF